MTDEAMDLSEQLAAELAANDEDMSRDEIEAAQSAPRIVDTKAMPARFFHLAQMGRSAAHGLASFQTKYANDSLSIRIGAGTHAMLLNKPFAVFTGGQRRKGTEKKASPWDLFQKEHAGKVIMNAKEHAHARAMVASIKAHPIANRLLFSPGVVHEETLLFEQDGRARQSTPDARGAYHVAEVKTAKTVEPRAFARDAHYRNYAAQVADQCAAIEAKVGVKPREAYVVAVENTYPYVVQCFQFTTRALERGAKLCREWLDRLTVCEVTGLWTGYSMGVEALDVMDTFVDADDDDEDADPWKGADA